jgi:hypothetical protein
MAFKSDTYADLSVGIHACNPRRKYPRIVERMQPSSSPHATAYGSAGRSVSPGPIPPTRYGFIVQRERRAFRVRRCIVCEFWRVWKLQKFGGEGRGRQWPRSRYGAHPRPTAERPDPISLAIDRDDTSSAVLYAGERIFMRHHDLWGRRSVPGRDRRAHSAPKDRSLCRILQAVFRELSISKI